MSPMMLTSCFECSSPVLTETCMFRTVNVQETSLAQWDNGVIGFITVENSCPCAQPILRSYKDEVWIFRRKNTLALAILSRTFLAPPLLQPCLFPARFQSDIQKTTHTKKNPTESKSHACTRLTHKDTNTIKHPGTHARTNYFLNPARGV